MRVLTPDKFTGQPQPKRVIAPEILGKQSLNVPPGGPVYARLERRSVAPDSPLGILRKFKIPAPLSASPISGYSPQELQAYLDQVFQSAKAGESIVSQMVLIQREERFIEEAGSALERAIPRANQNLELLDAKVKQRLAQLRGEIENEIREAVLRTSPEEATEALQGVRRWRKELTRPVSFRDPRTWPTVLRRWSTRRNLEQCLEKFSVEDNRRIYVLDVGNGNGTPPEFQFLEGSEGYDLDQRLEMERQRHSELYDAPNLLERRAALIAGLRAKLHRIGKLPDAGVNVI